MENGMNTSLSVDVEIVSDLEKQLMKATAKIGFMIAGAIAASMAPAFENLADSIEDALDKVLSRVEGLEIDGIEVDADQPDTTAPALIDAGAAGTTSKFADKLKEQFKSLQDKIKSLTPSMSQLMKGLSQVGKKALDFAKGLLKVTPGMMTLQKLGTLGAAGMKKLGSKMGELAKSGFKVFTDYLKSSINADKAFSTSLDQVKGNLKVAFMPIYNFIMPAINALMSLLVTAASYVANFMALLFGTTVEAGAESVKSLEAAGKAAEKYGDSAGEAAEAVGQLGIDELNILEDTESSSGSGGASVPKLDTGNVAVAMGEIESFINRIFGPAKAAWKDYGEYAVTAWRSALESVKTAMLAMGKTWLQVWENGTGYETIKNILILLTDIGLWIDAIATAWLEAWSREGENFIQSYFDMLNGLLSLIHSISESFRNAWNDGAGADILSHILGILTDIQNTIANLANGFKAAWDSAGIGDRIASGILKIVSNILGTIRDITNATAEWVKNLDFTPLLNSVAGLLEALEPLTDTIGQGLKGFYEEVLLPLAGWVIEDIIPNFLDILAGAIEILDIIISDAMAAFSWLWENFLSPVASWTGGIIVTVLEGIAEGLKAIAQNELVIAIIEGLAIALGLLAAGIAVYNVGLAAASAVTTAFSAALVLVNSSMFIVITVIGLVIAAIILLIKNWDFVKETVIAVWDSIVEKFQNALLWLQETFQNGWNLLCELLTGAIIAFQEKITEIWNNITEAFQNFMTWVQEIFQTDWSESLGFLGELLNGFFVTVGEIWDGIQLVFEGIMDFIKGVFTGDWEAAWEGIKKIFKGIWESFEGIAKAPINGVLALMNGMIDGINSVIEKINSIKVDLPFGGGSIGFNLPTINKIPYLAQGGYVGPNQPQLAMIGDNRHEGEIVSPESKLEAMAMRAAGIAMAGQDGNESEQLFTIIELMQKMVGLLENLDLMVNIDTRELHRKLKDVSKRVGYSFN